MTVSKGGVVEIFKNNVSITPEPMTLTEDLVLNLSSNFESLMGGEANKFLTAASGLVRGAGVNANFTGQFKQFGFQQWSSTQPIGFSFTVEINMKSNALTDVMLPSIELMKLPLPTDASESGGGIGLIAPGPPIGTALGKSNINLLYLRAGFLLLNPIIIKKVEPSFNRYTDDQDYPISVILRIDAETIFTATTNMIDRFLYKDKKRLQIDTGRSL